MAPSALRTEYRRAKKQWPFIDDVEKRNQLPSRMLYAVGWRESNLQNIQGDFSKRPGEKKEQFHGFGVWQRDSDAFGVDESYLKNVRKQARDAGALLAANFKIFKRWDAALAAYNAGPGNVQDALDAGKHVDSVTTGNDYSADVMRNREVLVGKVKDEDKDKPEKPDVMEAPARKFFRPGQSHPNFTKMGERFLVWLKGDISKSGARYVPGPKFSANDRQNVRKCQILMGDEPDGWFGPTQWKMLLTSKPPRIPRHKGVPPAAGLRVTQGFGIKNPDYDAGEHTGVDFGDCGDDNIRCVRHGVVVVSDLDDDWGNYVIVQHPGGRFSWYAHMTGRRVNVGDKVRRGQTLGMMGMTGKAHGKHLHYQESVGGHQYSQYVRPNMLSIDV